jgi:hypothetical protein
MFRGKELPEVGVAHLQAVGVERDAVAGGGAGVRLGKVPETGDCARHIYAQEFEDAHLGVGEHGPLAVP